MWRHIERVGTVDNLRRIATVKNVDPEKAATAALRIRQAVELRRASRDLSPLSRPLPLYYSALNLVRGVLLAYFGEFGPPRHGLAYKGSSALVECAASVTKEGTFTRFAHSVAPQLSLELEGKVLSLRDAFAVIPELWADFPLLKAGPSCVACVRVDAFVRGDLLLTFSVHGTTAQEFDRSWPELFHWLKDDCERTAKPFQLRVKEPPKDEAAIGDFLRLKLLHDLVRRDNAIWFDHVARPGVTLQHRLTAYLAALFILSNVSRYEPELLDAVTRESTDVGYVVGTFLDGAERFFPQLILELLNGGKPHFFE